MTIDKAANLVVDAPQAARSTLFQNMNTPASSLAGAMVPLVVMGPLPIQANNDKDAPLKPWDRRMRQSYIVVGWMSLLSELLAVVSPSQSIDGIIRCPGHRCGNCSKARVSFTPVRGECALCAGLALVPVLG